MLKPQWTSFHLKKTKSVANWENIFRSSLRAVQCASVSPCARHLLKHFSCRSFRMIRTTDDLGMPVFYDTLRTVLWARGWSSWFRTISFTWSMFSWMRTLCSLSLSWCLSTESLSLNFLSNPLMLLIVHLSPNSPNFYSLTPTCLHRQCWHE